MLHIYYFQLYQNNHITMLAAKLMWYDINVYVIFGEDICTINSLTVTDDSIIQIPQFIPNLTAHS